MAEDRTIQERLAAVESQLSELYRHLGIEEPSSGGWWGDEKKDAPESDPEVLRLISEGKEIHAIKRYRELTGLGLKEAKEAVESLIPGR